MRLIVPDIMLQKHPNLTKNEIRTILRVILNARTARLKKAHVVDFSLPHFGRFKSHGNKKKKKYRSLDRKKKKRYYEKMLLRPEKLLF